MRIYNIRNIQPGSLAFRLQLPGSFVSNLAVCRQSARKNLQLSAEYCKHPSVRVQHSYPSDHIILLMKNNEDNIVETRATSISIKFSILE